MSSYRNRITGMEYVSSKDLTPHPGNWREHGKAQVQALQGVLSEVGIAGALLAYRSERNGGKLTVIDGHLRKDAAPQTWPVLILDVDDAEADYLLATHDPLAAMATADAAALDALLSSVNSGDAAVQAMLERLAGQAGLYVTDPAAEWQGMPEFEQEAQEAYQTIKVHFDSAEDVQDFAKLIGQSITPKTGWLWHPKKERANLLAYSVQDES